MTGRYVKRLMMNLGKPGAAEALAAGLGGMVYAACLRELRYPEYAAGFASELFYSLKPGTVISRGDLRYALLLHAKKAARHERARRTQVSGESFWEREDTGCAELCGVLDRLDDTTSDIFYLYFGAGMQTREIAKAMGMPRGAVSWRYRAALDGPALSDAERRIRALFDEFKLEAARTNTERGENSPEPEKEWRGKVTLSQWLPYTVVAAASVAAIAYSVLAAIR